MAELTNDDLDELERLEREATMGPWAVSDRDSCWHVYGPPVGGSVMPPSAFDDGSAGDEYSPQCTRETRDFLVALRNVTPELIRRAREADELRRLILNAFETELRYSEMERAFVTADGMVPGMAEAAKARNDAENAIWLKGQELFEARELAAKGGE